MLFFVQLTVQEKSGGRYDGSTPALAAGDVWERYIEEENAE